MGFAVCARMKNFTVANWRGSVADKEFAPQSVDMGSCPILSHTEDFENGIPSFPG